VTIEPPFKPWIIPGLFYFTPFYQPFSFCCQSESPPPKRVVSIDSLLLVFWVSDFFMVKNIPHMIKRDKGRIIR